MAAALAVLRLEHVVWGLEVMAEMSPDQLSPGAVERAFAGLEAGLEEWDSASCEVKVPESLISRAVQVAFRLLPRWPDALFYLVRQHRGMDGVSDLVENDPGWGLFGSDDCREGFLVARREYMDEVGEMQEAAELPVLQLLPGEAAGGPRPIVTIRLEGDCRLVTLGEQPACPHEGSCDVDEIDCPQREGQGSGPDSASSGKDACPYAGACVLEDMCPGLGEEACPMSGPDDTHTIGP